VARPQADIAFTAVVLLLAVLALIFGSWLIVQPPIPLGPDILAMSPSLFPTLIVAVTAIVSLLYLVGQARIGMLWKTPGTSEPVAQAAAIYRQIFFVAITVGCALALTSLGFLTTMFLLMASTSILVGNRSPIQILSLSIVLPLSFYIAVTHVLRTELPEADVIERALAPFMQMLPSV
jgi:putative tricarboxylic transport membrane protein